jgi:hypothetical protein
VSSVALTRTAPAMDMTMSAQHHRNPEELAALRPEPPGWGRSDLRVAMGHSWWRETCDKERALYSAAAARRTIRPQDRYFNVRPPGPALCGRNQRFP